MVLPSQPRSPLELIDLSSMASDRGRRPWQPTRRLPLLPHWSPHSTVVPRRVSDPGTGGAWGGAAAQLGERCILNFKGQRTPGGGGAYPGVAPAHSPRGEARGLSEGAALNDHEQQATVVLEKST
jgi:hypothetical protein